jgi:hypothetical protein
MTRRVKIAPDYEGEITMPDGNAYKAKDEFDLTDEEFAQIPEDMLEKTVWEVFLVPPGMSVEEPE